jgi:prolyl oligopeptidase
MNQKLFLYFMVAAFFPIMISCQNERPLKYPQTAMLDVVDEYFGVLVPDPFQWLEDDNSPETKAWVEEQNKVTFDYLGRIPFRERLRERLTELWDFERYTTPFWQGSYYFYFKNDGMQNHSVLYVREGIDGESRMLIDPNQMCQEGTISLSGLGISADGKYLSYGISKGGSDWREFFVKEVATGKDLEDHLKWIKFSGMAWQGDGFYYSRYDQPAPGQELSAANEYHKVFYHRLGTSQDKDILIYQDKNHSRRNFSAWTSQDERFLVIYESQGSSGNALQVKDLSKPKSGFVRIIEGFDYNHTIIDNNGSKLLMLTNYMAPRYRLVEVDPAKPTESNWREVIPESENVLRGVNFIGGRIIANYLQDASSKAFIYSLDGEKLDEVKLPGLGSLGGFSGKKDQDKAFFSFTSFVYPSTIFQFDVKANEYQVYFAPDIPGFNPEEFETKQVFYQSKDGTQVPMFITHKKGIKLNGKNPTTLYGYGGFNVSRTPSFSVSNLPWYENGGIYVVANIRGGGEYGREWHRAGTQLNKQNTFDDFIAAAEYLIEHKYTSAEKLAIRGGSNGGLLVGAVINQRPDLFRVAVPAVGVMDMLKYHKFTIGWAWVPDYGSSDDSLHFHNLYAYSPLHNIRQGVNYPATLVTTADHDDRVVPAHSFKYIAQLQKMHAGPNPVIIRIETQAGHGAGKPTSKIIEEVADMLAFTWYNMGVRPKL